MKSAHIDSEAGRGEVNATRSTGPRLASAWRQADAQHRWIVANLCLVAFAAAVLVGTSPLQEWVFSSPVGSGDVLNQLVFVGIFLTLVFGAQTPTLRQLLPVPLGVVLLLGYCLVSVLWAIDPLVAIRRWGLAAITVWISFRLVGDLGPGRTLRILRWALIAMLIANYLAVLLTPYGIHSVAFGQDPMLVGNWRGIVPHKNITGAICALTVILFVFDNRTFPKMVSWATIAGALIFLYFTNSRTSEIVLAASLAAGWIIRLYSPNYRAAAAVFLFLCAILGLQLLATYTDRLEELLTDPAQLTGRTMIWPLLLEYIGEHPMTGAGFGSFWHIGEASPIWRLTSGWVARLAPHGHNGYLDLAVTIGIPGMLLAIVALLLWPFVRLLLSLDIDKPRRSLLLALLTFGAGHNLSESSLMNGASLVHVFLLFAVAIIYFDSRSSPGLHHRLRAHLLHLLPSRDGAVDRSTARAQRRGRGAGRRTGRATDLPPGASSD